MPASASAVGVVGAGHAREVAIGLALACALQALVAGVEFAGHLSGYQIGYSYAATIDPMSGARNSIVTALFGLLAVLTLLGDQRASRHPARAGRVLRRRCRSVAGRGRSLVERVRDILALVFIVGVRLAAPIVIVC